MKLFEHKTIGKVRLKESLSGFTPDELQNLYKYAREGGTRYTDPKTLKQALLKFYSKKPKAKDMEVFQPMWDKESEMRNWGMLWSSTTGDRIFSFLWTNSIRANVMEKTGLKYSPKFSYNDEKQALKKQEADKNLTAFYIPELGDRLPYWMINYADVDKFIKAGYKQL